MGLLVKLAVLTFEIAIQTDTATPQASGVTISSNIKAISENRSSWCRQIHIARFTALCCKLRI
jgi:hypothetical protein